MNCSEIRDLLIRGDGGEAVEGHLGDCPACRTFAERATKVLAGLREHDARAIADAGFAARVRAALPRPVDPFAWAAVRLLPATAALAVVLTGWCLLSVPGPSELLAESPSDDPLAWLLEVEETEEAP